MFHSKFRKSTNGHNSRDYGGWGLFLLYHEYKGNIFTLNMLYNVHACTLLFMNMVVGFSYPPLITPLVWMFPP